MVEFRACSADLVSPADLKIVNQLLKCWRAEGPQSVRRQLMHLPKSGLLLEELHLRLEGVPGPRLLVDGLWWTRPFGGVTRVWEQILRVWHLPGLITPAAPVALIRRGDEIAAADGHVSLPGLSVDPLDHGAVMRLGGENACLARSWRADVFLSSWTSLCGDINDQAAWPELALVHDCMPERSRMDQAQQQLRRFWLLRARRCLAVSADTAKDLEGLRRWIPAPVPWCHPGSDLGVAADALVLPVNKPYVLLPGTSRVGSYKNPELVARALRSAALLPLQLVITGLDAQRHGEALEQRFPHLNGRWQAIGCSDAQLRLLYRGALAVVMPSRIEGYGLPVLEALQCGATVLSGDSRGLREAGAGAVMRFDTETPAQLSALLEMLMDASSGSWLQPILQRRRQERLEQIAPGCLGLALLAIARTCLRQ